MRMRRRHSVELGLIFALASACGGNVETGSPGPGGSTGYGTGGMRNGTGGAVATGGGGNVTQVLDGYVDQICAQAAQLPCGSPDVLTDCYPNGYELVTRALGSGCDTLARSALQCGATTGLHCDTNGMPAFTDECTARFAALDDCATPSDPPPTSGCSGTASGGPNGTTSCSVQCGALSTTCNATSTGITTCTCDNGRNAGLTFQIASCDSLMAVPDACY